MEEVPDSQREREKQVADEQAIIAHRHNMWCAFLQFFVEDDEELNVTGT